MDGQLDVAMVSMFEHKFEKSRFTRVDSDVVDRLIAKDEPKNEELASEKKEILSSVFRSQLPSMNKVEFNVETQAMGENATPIMITQSEYMRRMKEMAHIQAGMSFYGEMPDMFNVVLNSDHKLVKQVLADTNVACSEELLPIETSIAALNFEQAELQKKQEGKKYDEISQADKDALNDVEKKLADEKSKKDTILGKYAGGNKIIRQLVDLALLQNNMLKGEALNNFIKRSIELI
jgi:molecular chaperone HtpG